MQPYMRQDEIAAFTRLLDEQPGPLRVLEWGSGGSTMTFACHPNVLSWLSIEHDQNWHVRMRRTLDQGKHKAVRQKVSLRFAPGGDAYLSEPAGSEYDLIFIDGRWRNECLVLAPQYLAPGGVVLIHDCDRARYQPDMDSYPERARLSRGNIKHQGLMLLRPDVDELEPELEFQSEPEPESDTEPEYEYVEMESV